MMVPKTLKEKLPLRLILPPRCDISALLYLESSSAQIGLEPGAGKLQAKPLIEMLLSTSMTKCQLPVAFRQLLKMLLDRQRFDPPGVSRQIIEGLSYAN
jgi:hypothetical protein